jgi:hypothetical protein
VLSSNGLDFTPLPSTTCTIVPSCFRDPFLSYSLHSPDCFFHVFSCLWHTGVIPWACFEYPLLSSADHSFSFRAGSSRSNSLSPAFRELQRAAQVNRLLRSILGLIYNGQPSPTVSMTPFYLRQPPPLAAESVPSQIRRATSPINHNTSRDGSPETLSSNQQSLSHPTFPQRAHSRIQPDLLQYNPIR